MQTLPRYVLLEFIKVLVVSLVAATALMMIVGVMKEAMRQGLGLAQIILLIPYVLPDALRFAVPGVTLFAACSVFGSLSGSNEIVAIKSLGISPMRLLTPVLVFSCLISFVALWLNDVAVSWGRTGVRRVVVESVEEIAYSMLRSQRRYSTSRLAINVIRVEGRRLIGPTFSMKGSGDKPSLLMTAEYGELRTNPEQNTLTVIMHNGSIEMGDHFKMTFPDTIERVIPLPDATNSKTDATGPSQMPLRVIPDQAIAQEERIEELEQQQAADAAYQMMTGDFDELTSDAWGRGQANLRDQRYRLYRLRTEPHRRWANGFSCLCFVMIGAPLAIRLRNADFLTSFFICFLPILLIYYPLMAYGVDRAKSGALPPQIVWLGNLILMLLGVWQMRRVIRY